MAVSSARNLMSGAVTVSTTSGSKVLTFSSNQSFKEGATVVVDPAGTPQKFTIDSGSGTTWAAMQDATATASGKSFKASQTSTSRARGGADSYIIPNAAQFMYRATQDDAGLADLYFYFDTLFPENGIHPYTRDQYAGLTWPSAKTVAAMIPDALTRLRILEGAVRGSAGDTINPDKRIKDLFNRVTALEQWANGGGAPSVGSNPSPTVADFLTYGDAQ